MPIYEYKCLECGTNIEKIQKTTDAPLSICEKCGGKLEKQVSLSGFQFKGAGWYVTDYAGKKADKPVTKTEKPTDTKTEKNSIGESTTKTEPASKTTQSSSGSDTSPKKD